MFGLKKSAAGFFTFLGVFFVTFGIHNFMYRNEKKEVKAFCTLFRVCCFLFLGFGLRPRPRPPPSLFSGGSKVLLQFPTLKVNVQCVFDRSRTNKTSTVHLMS